MITADTALVTGDTARVTGDGWFAGNDLLVGGVMRARIFVDAAVSGTVMTRLPGGRMQNVLWAGENDNAIVLDQLFDELNGVYINDATVTLVELKDPAGTNVPELSYPVTMPYLSGTNGRYAYVAQQVLTITPGVLYTAKVRAVRGSLDAAFYKTIPCRKRFT